MTLAEECAGLSLDRTNSFCWVSKALSDKSLNELGAVMEALRRIGILVLIVLFLTVGVSYGQDTAEQFRAKGAECGAQGKFKEAKEEYEKALKIDPFDFPAKGRLKIIEDVMGKKIDSKTAIHIFKGLAYGDKGQVDKAISEINKAIELNRRYADTYLTRGQMYEFKGQYDKAISDYNKAIKIDPMDARPYVNRGLAYKIKENYDRAISDYTKAIEINPKLAMAYNNRGIAYQEQEQYDKAISDYNKAIEINPNFAWAYNNRANVYRHKGQYEKAFSDYGKAIKINAKLAVAYANRGIAYQEQEQYDKAISDYTKAIEINPKFTGAYTRRGFIYMVKLGDQERGCSDFKRAFELGDIRNYLIAIQRGKCEPPENLRLPFN